MLESRRAAVVAARCGAEDHGPFFSAEASDRAAPVLCFHATL